jgi:hypothetical protein
LLPKKHNTGSVNNSNSDSEMTNSDVNNINSISDSDSSNNSNVINKNDSNDSIDSDNDRNECDICRNENMNNEIKNDDDEKMDIENSSLNTTYDVDNNNKIDNECQGIFSTTYELLCDGNIENVFDILSTSPPNTSIILHAYGGINAKRMNDINRPYALFSKSCEKHSDNLIIYNKQKYCSECKKLHESFKNKIKKNDELLRSVHDDQDPTAVEFFCYLDMTKEQFQKLPKSVLLALLEKSQKFEDSNDNDDDYNNDELGGLILLYCL